METPIVYVICDNNCKFESMTKEQILAAIMQAVNEGTIGNVDGGFITTVKTVNGLPLRFFVGEQAAYDALSEEEKKNLFALITNDTTKDGITEAIKTLQDDVGGLEKAIKTLQKDTARVAHLLPTLTEGGYYHIRAQIGGAGGEYYDYGLVRWSVGTVTTAVGRDTWLCISVDGGVTICNEGDGSAFDKSYVLEIVKFG